MTRGTGKLAVLFFVGVLVLGAYFWGFQAGRSEARIVPIEGAYNLQEGKPELVDFSLFWDAWRILQEKYAAKDSLDYQAMVEGAVAGMVKSLGDPYTVFMDAQETKIFRDDISGSFEGVGIEIGIQNRELRVIAPLQGTPAQKAGLRAGDAIVRIEDTFTSDLTLEEVVSLIRGPRGTKVTLGILREGWLEPRDFTMARAVIEVPSLEWDILEGNVAYIQLFQFSEKAGRDFARAANEVLQSPADRIILDLRNNPGGFLEVAVDVAGWFLERDQVVVLEDFGEKEKEQTYKAKGNGRLGSLPLVILLNQGSASASEIVAGALRDHKEVLLVGEKSFGKGSVQELEELSEDTSLKVTVANWLTPNGNHITNVGLSPDVRVELTPEDFDQERDPQLDKALEIIKNL